MNCDCAEDERQCPGTLICEKKYVYCKECCQYEYWNAAGCDVYATQMKCNRDTVRGILDGMT